MRRFFAKHPLGLFPEYRKYYFGTFISSVGDVFYSIAISWWVLNNAQDAPFQLGLVLAMNYLPKIVFSPYIGVIVDNHDRKLCMLIADISRFVIVGIVAWLLGNNALSLPVLYAVAVALGIFSALFESAAGASMLDFCTRDYISKVVATNATKNSISVLIGAFSGSLVFSLIGLQGAFWLNSLSFVISFIFIFNINVVLSSKMKEKGSHWGLLKQGFGYVVNNKKVLSLCIYITLVNFFLAMFFVLIPVYVREVIHGTIATVAMLEGVMAVGSLCAALVLSYRRIPCDVYKTIEIALLVNALLFIVGYMIINVWLFSFVLFAMSIVVFVISNPISEYFQLNVPAEMKGRFFAMISVVITASVPVSLSLCGWLVGCIGTMNIIAMCGIAMLTLAGSVRLIPK